MRAEVVSTGQFDTKSARSVPEMDRGSSQKLWHSLGRAAPRVFQKVTRMNVKRVGHWVLIVTSASVLMTAAASAGSPQQGRSSIAETPAPTDVPHDLPKAATQ